jgi:hypothetical protein
MAAKNKLLTVLSEAEQYALYGLPDFDDAQRLEYLALTETELALAVRRPGSHAQVYCVLQIGFFKAKHAVLCEPGELLHRIRPASTPARVNQPLSAMLCLAALSAAYR